MDNAKKGDLHSKIDGLQKELDEVTKERDLYKEAAHKQLSELNSVADFIESHLVDGKVESAIEELFSGFDQIKKALSVYGDHRWKCAIKKAMQKSSGSPSRYPECDCGWTKPNAKRRG